MTRLALLIVAAAIITLLILRVRLIFRTRELHDEVAKTRALIARTRALTAIIKQRRNP